MADTAPTETPAPSSAADAPIEPPKRNLVVPIILVVLVVAALAGGGFYAFSSRSASAASKTDAHAEKDGEHGAAEHEEEPEHAEEEKGGEKKPGETAKPSVRFADFVIHLRNTDTDRYARASFEVEVGSESDKSAVNARTNAIRDAIIAYLSDRSAEELQGSKALGKAKEQLLETIKEMVPKAKVRALYVTDFVVQ